MLLSGDLLISSQVPFTTSYSLMEYTQQGVQVNSQSIPQAPGANETEHARGLSVGPSGDVNVFDGTATPSLATLSASTSNWSFQTASGWSTANNITYGEVAAYNNYIFASDMGSSNGQTYGLVRFDSSGGSPVLFAPGSNSLQVTLGLDGQLYELEGGPPPNYNPNYNPTIQVFNPDTLALERTFTLNTGAGSTLKDIRSIAVDSSGNVYAASFGGSVTKFDSNGNSTGTSVVLKNQNGITENLVNIALDSDGQIAVGGKTGDVFLTDESLASVQSFQTGQSNVFVTFDHYIGAAPQIVTPTFSNLAGPTITYGQSSVTLGGQIAANSAFPPGSVNITLAGVTESAAINAADGTFSAVFDTSALGVSGSPYTITYSYPGANNYAAITDTSQSLTVKQAVTTLNNLSSATIVYGTPTVTLSGTVGSNSVLPVGQDVTVTLIGSGGPVATSSGTIGSDGTFSVSINTGTLAAGSYTIQYSYAGDDNFTAVTDTSQSLTVKQAVTTLNNLSSATIIYGTSTVTLSGTVGSNSVLPVGQSVTVTLIGTGGTVASGSGMIASDGTFSTTINTSGLSAGSYTIQYAYAGDNNFTAVTDTSKSLIVSPATTTLSNLSSRSIVIGTSTTTFSGIVGSNSVLPVGQSVTVSIVGAKGVLASGSGTIASDGSFQVAINTAALPAGTYTIQYQYAGDGNFTASSGTGTLQVSYAIKLCFDNTKPVQAGEVLPIKLQVTDASGNNLSSKDLTVTAVSLIGPNGATYTPHAKGPWNPGNVFHHSRHGYRYNLDTTGLAPGTYTLMVKVGNDPVLHAITFVIAAPKGHHGSDDCHHG